MSFFLAKSSHFVGGLGLGSLPSVRISSRVGDGSGGYGFFSRERSYRVWQLDVDTVRCSCSREGEEFVYEELGCVACY
jgi:hypothetical protein